MCGLRKRGGRAAATHHHEGSVVIELLGYHNVHEANSTEQALHEEEQGLQPFQPECRERLHLPHRRAGLRRWFLTTNRPSGIRLTH